MPASKSASETPDETDCTYVYIDDSWPPWQARLSRGSWAKGVVWAKSAYGTQRWYELYDHLIIRRFNTGIQLIVKDE